MFLHVAPLEHDFSLRRHLARNHATSQCADLHITPDVETFFLRPVRCADGFCNNVTCPCIQNPGSRDKTFKYKEQVLCAIGPSELFSEIKGTRQEARGKRQDEQDEARRKARQGEARNGRAKVGGRVRESARR